MHRGMYGGTLLDYLKLIYFLCAQSFNYNLVVDVSPQVSSFS